MPKCKSCGKQIIFVEMPTGNIMPLDAFTKTIYTIKGDLFKQVTRHVGHEPHWATCDNPNKFRKEKDK